MKNKKHNKGFTLIEVIIALAIISILSMVFFNIINSSIRHNAKNEKDIKSLNIAQSEIESLRNQIKKQGWEIIIYNPDGSTLIEIPNDGDIIWKETGTSIKTEVIEVKSDGIYQQYIGTEGDNVIQYKRTVEGDPVEYIVKLKLSRQKKSSKYLYNIEVKVIPENNKLSKKEIILNTSVLSK